MNKTLILGLAAMAAVSVTSCKTASKSTAANASELILNKWTIQSVNGSDVKTEKDLFLEFGAGNRMHGQVGCNIFNTTYTLTPASNQLKFSENGQRTMMYCPDMNIEDEVVKAIGATTAYRFENNGKSMLLLNAAGKTVLKLNR